MQIEHEEFIKSLMEAGPEELDLTISIQQEMVLNSADQILNKIHTLDELNSLEIQLMNLFPKDTFIHLVLKIAKSKLYVRQIFKPLYISLVFAVYKENNRIKTKLEHPHGEDFLRMKINQLKWLFGDKPNIRWSLIVVDDGCPENSGQIAQQIVDNEGLNQQVTVLFLKDAIEAKLPPAKGLSSTSDSQKGGSILYGMWHASRMFKDDNHIIIYTDADLSTHLGQIGLLLNPILKGSSLCAIGSRREETSVVIKKGKRNSRGKLFIYLWKRLIPILEDIIDTQCGFKAFDNRLLQEIFKTEMIEKRFAFDIELLLKSELIHPNSIQKVPIAWIDSEEASTTTDLQPYLSMLKSIAKMYLNYLPKNEASEEFIDFINSLNEENFNQIVDNIPKEILNREPSDYSTFDGVKVDDLRMIH